MSMRACDVPCGRRKTQCNPSDDPPGPMFSTYVIPTATALYSHLPKPLLVGRGCSCNTNVLTAPTSAVPRLQWPVIYPHQRQCVHYIVGDMCMAFHGIAILRTHAGDRARATFRTFRDVRVQQWTTIHEHAGEVATEIVLIATDGTKAEFESA